MQASHPADMTGSDRSRPPQEQSAADLHHEAVSLQQAGRLSDAADRCAEILHRTRDHAGALRLLGVIRAQQGRLASAARLMRASLASDAGAAEDHNNLGMVLHALGRAGEAIACYETALALQPRYAIALNNCGIALAALARHDEAIARYQAALAIQPEYAEAMNNLGAALHAIGRHEAAAEQFRHALSIRRDFVEAHINLGHAWAELGRADAAIACYRSALRQQPMNAAFHVNLADTLFRVHRQKAALHHYNRACAIDPRSGDAHAGRGAVLQELGRMDEARQCFERAVAAAPAQAQHYLRLARSAKSAARPAHLAAMLALAGSNASLDAEGAIHIHFALGEALAAAGDHQSSFEHLRLANRLKRNTVSYDESSELGEFDRIATVFTPAMMRAGEGRGHPSRTPVFIVGMPRSGSTLVEQVLASHPAVFGAGEVRTLGEAIKYRLKQSDGVPFPEAAPHWMQEQLCEIAVRYLRGLMQLTPKPDGTPPITRITDKMLSNFRYLGLIHLMLPNARIIHTCRDPVDTCLSCFSLQFARLNFTYDLGELGRRYRAYVKLMRHWHAVLPRGAILDVRYEDMVDNLDVTARRIVAHCGLEWNDSCLSFYRTDRPVRTASVVQVRHPIYRSSVGRWRPDVDSLRPLLDALETECTDINRAQGLAGTPAHESAASRSDL